MKLASIIFAALVIASWPLGATLTKDPTNCSSRPCTYTITCGSATCTSGEVAEVQTALDDMECGDTVKLEAGRTFPSSDALNVSDVGGACSASSRWTITPTKDSELPPAGTRITRAYMDYDVLPIIQATSAAQPGLGVSGNSTPASHGVIRGVAFDMAAAATTGALLIGAHSAGDFGGTVDTQVEQPDDIVVQHVVMVQDSTYTPARMLGMHGSSVQILDSYIESAYHENNGETQSIWVQNTAGPFTLRNTYVGGATENLMSGGSVPLFDVELNNALIEFNYFPQIPQRARFQRWTANRIHFKGNIVTPSTGGSNRFRAQSTCTTDGSEPTWPGTVEQTVEDGTCTWYFKSSAGADVVIKNNLELKAGMDITLRHNVFSTYWRDGQNQIVIVKAPNQPSQSCSGSVPTCYEAKTGRVHFISNVFRHMHQGPGFSQCEDSGLCRYTGMDIFRNNLLWDLDTTVNLTGWGVDGGSALTNQYEIAVSALFLNEPGVTLEHNTIQDITGAQNYDIGLIGAGSPGTYNMLNPVRYNIIPRITWGVRGLDPQTAEGTTSITERVCDGATPDVSCWDDNLMVGTNPSSYPASTIWTTDTAAVKYSNVAARNYHLTYDSPGKGASADGRDVGVNFHDLPLVSNFTATPLDIQVLFTWDVSGPIKDIPCVIEVSSSPDLVPSIADLDPDTYGVPESDAHNRSVRRGARRMVLVGANSPLTPETVYYYRLQCGGDVVRYEDDGDTLRSVTTVASLAGTVPTVVAYNRSGSQTLEYGTVYSRSTDTISSGGTDTETCAGNCTFGFTANRGEVYYYRIQGEADVSVLAVE